jgi:2'-5' RNA ligase
MRQQVRTFVAVEIDDSVLAHAARLIGAFRAVPADVKWVDPQNMHLTVKFLGDVDVREVHQVCQAVQKAVADLAPFELELHGTGAFPNLTRPRTIWLGVRAGAEAMTELNRRVEAELGTLGYPREGRAFTAHLTLGRVRGGGEELADLGRLVAQHADEPIGATGVDRLVIFSSQLARTGPVYEPLGHADLGG